ncbi:uncharacterized protein LAESUDRAFT_709054 [Laetiporus sulphureus 93-53]|uniref:Uncharacterized protein n=1 Tax=Laetiporus sulphureus 93-53 TaxID=1314785 RepID=A0A165B5Q0_9APHY|nr:uncharacterized protein LAESUDRAFT_709054 [Laetiporus sulphureus 93-53]KZT00296.1 hypothetical protein LAESUDRAFT_709054 [Laetiporus sulphureus 93-53]
MPHSRGPSMEVTLTQKEANAPKQDPRNGTSQAHVSGRGRAQRAEEDSQGTAAKLTEAEKTLQKLNEDRAQLRQITQNLEEHFRALQKEFQREEQARQESRHALATAQKKHELTVELLQTRTAELQDAQKYLGKNDGVSDADVVGSLEALNSQIFQMAARLAGTLEYRPERRAAGPGAKGVGDTEHFVGRSMVVLLLEQPHHKDPICVQIALQAMFVSRLNNVIAAWSFTNQEHENIFQEIYLRLRRGENQTVFGRWRALSRGYLDTLSKEEDTVTVVQNYLVRGVTDVVVTSGSALGPECLGQLLKNQYGGKLKSIVLAALEIRKVIGERVISCDIEVIGNFYDVPFDPKTMEDEYASNKDKHAGPSSRKIRVLCATSMGCQRIGRGAEDETRVVLLLKPNIVLETVVKELQISEKHSAESKKLRGESK